MPEVRPALSLPASCTTSRPARPALRLALAGVLVAGLSLPTLALPAVAAVPPAASAAQPAGQARVDPLPCGVRVTLAEGSGPRAVLVEVRTAAPTTPAGRDLELVEDGRWSAQAGERRDFVLDLGDAQAGDPQGHRVEVAVTVDDAPTERTEVWLPSCRTPSASPTTSPTADPTTSPTADPTTSPAGDPQASPTTTPVAGATASATATATTTPTATGSPSATATATTGARPAPAARPSSSPAAPAPAPAPAAPAPASVPAGGTGVALAPVLSASAVGGTGTAAGPVLVGSAPLVAGAPAALPPLGLPETAPPPAAPAPQVAAGPLELFPAPVDSAPTDVESVPMGAPTALPLTEADVVDDLLPAGTALALCVAALAGMVRRRRA